MNRDFLYEGIAGKLPCVRKMRKAGVVATCVYRCMHAFKSTILVLCRMGRSWQNTESGKLPCVRKMRKAGVVATCVYSCMHAHSSICRMGRSWQNTESGK